ncbi:MAG: long-chain-acyl-CoA synthetase [Alphaproteobacteria bacterium]|nr:long-chain-acyl-CoA synthetase [Alphaproteobacteria bacterium]
MGIFQRIGRDIALIGGLQRTLKAYGNLSADGAYGVGDELERAADRFPAREAIRFEGRALSYAELDALANRFAHWALGQGLTKGDTVALFMTNRPEYIACWLGLAKVGVITGLINTNLAGQPLIHTISISGARHVIVSSDLADPYFAIEGQIAPQPVVWAQGGTAPGALDLDAALAACPISRPPKIDIKGGDIALYVYTSGTTGAPKAAKMPQWRVMGMMRAFVGGGRGVAEDRVYITLPLYHGTGGLCGVGFAITTGACIILRRKFSASHFWEDAVREQATVFFYIGELCRYLLSQPPHPDETRHKLRLAVGNGMRPDVWERLQARFKIGQILEFYGSTEGNVSMMNFDGKMGAIGRIPKFLKKRLNVRIVKFDVETETPIRGPDGLCIEAHPDEIGEALGEIRTDEVRYRFEGYSGDSKQTEKKILRNVFAEGDAWFRTGDLMRQDREGYFYFIDRIGDTFRWKGENVSTNEVGDLLAACDGVIEANVYGVQVGDLDGRAGMAAISVEPGFDITALHAEVTRSLPSYARPLFLRIQPRTDITGTFKYRKIDLVRDGFDPSQTLDQVYFDHPGLKSYAPMTPELYRQIQSGAFKL